MLGTRSAAGAGCDKIHNETLAGLGRSGAMRKKTDLPTKICETCARSFTWRKKWARAWADVKYCSERCRGAKGIKEAKPRVD